MQEGSDLNVLLLTLHHGIWRFNLTPGKCKVQTAILEMKIDPNGSESVNQHILSIKQEGVQRSSISHFHYT